MVKNTAIGNLSFPALHYGILQGKCLRLRKNETTSWFKLTCLRNAPKKDSF